jgi:hypothetical protein
MIIPPPFEFGSVSVADAGVPGQERVIFRPTEAINLAQCGLLVGWRQENGMTTPLDNYFLWFGNIVVTPPSWIVVYTGKGSNNRGTHNGQPVYYYYWGKDATIFNIREVIPLLFKLAGVQFGGHLKQLPTYEEFMAKHNPPSTLLG